MIITAVSVVKSTMGHPIDDTCEAATLLQLLRAVENSTGKTANAIPKSKIEKLCLVIT